MNIMIKLLHNYSCGTSTGIYLNNWKKNITDFTLYIVQGQQDQKILVFVLLLLKTIYSSFSLSITRQQQTRRKQHWQNRQQQLSGVVQVLFIVLLLLLLSYPYMIQSIAIQVRRCNCNCNSFSFQRQHQHRRRRQQQQQQQQFPFHQQQQSYKQNNIPYLDRSSCNNIITLFAKTSTHTTNTIDSRISVIVQQQQQQQQSRKGFVSIFGTTKKLYATKLFSTSAASSSNNLIETGNSNNNNNNESVIMTTPATIIDINKNMLTISTTTSNDTSTLIDNFHNNDDHDTSTGTSNTDNNDTNYNTVQVFNEWIEQYQDIMKDLMQQSRVISTFQKNVHNKSISISTTFEDGTTVPIPTTTTTKTISSSKLRKSKKRFTFLSDDEIRVVQEYLLEPILYNSFFNSNSNNNCIINLDSNWSSSIQQNSASTSTTTSATLESTPTKTTTTTSISFRDYIITERQQFWTNSSTSTTTSIFEQTQTKTNGDNTKKYYNFTNPDIQYEYASCCLSYMADICARKQLPGPCIVAWYKIRQCGIIPRENCISTLMYVFSLLPTTAGTTAGTSTSTGTATNGFTSSSNEKRAELSTISTTNIETIDKNNAVVSTTINRQDATVEEQQQLEDIITNACFEAASFHDLLYRPNEKTITLRIKMLIAKGDTNGAEAVLSSLPDRASNTITPVVTTNENKRYKPTPTTINNNNNEILHWKRLRTFLPILLFYCNDTTTTFTGSITGSSTNRCLDDKTISALLLFQQMRKSDGVHLDSETYGLLISTLARRGWFYPTLQQQNNQDHTDSNVLSIATMMSPDNAINAINLNDISNHDNQWIRKGPHLLDYILNEMADDILEINEADAKIIHNEFLHSMKLIGLDSNNIVTDDVSKFYKFSSSPRTNNDDSDAIVPSTFQVSFGRVTVDQATSICPESGAKLQLFKIDSSQRRHVHDTLLEMAGQLHEEFGEKLLQRRTNNNNNNINNSDNSNNGKGSNRTLTDIKLKKENDQESKPSTATLGGGGNFHDKEFAYTKLLEFSKWLRGESTSPESTNKTDSIFTSASRQQKRLFTAIVDGPNVAYFGHGDVHYSQIQNVVESLEQLGEKPLVIMPQKYIADKFWLAIGCTQELSVEAKKIRDNLLEKEQMYVVPTACLDDYYWMLASVAYDSDTFDDFNRLGQQVPAVGVDTTNNRLPGLRPLLITNDQMRDHRLSLLLEERSFRRWTSCHIVNYFIEPYQTNEWENRTITFKPADYFSREIQGNEVNTQLLHPYDSTINQSTIAWHIPITEWNDPDRFCLSITK